MELWQTCQSETRSVILLDYFLTSPAVNLSRGPPNMISLAPLSFSAVMSSLCTLTVQWCLRRDCRVLNPALGKKSSFLEALKRTFVLEELRGTSPCCAVPFIWGDGSIVAGKKSFYESALNIPHCMAQLRANGVVLLLRFEAAAKGSPPHKSAKVTMFIFNTHRCHGILNPFGHFSPSREDPSSLVCFPQF